MYIHIYTSTHRCIDVYVHTFAEILTYSLVWKLKGLVSSNIWIPFIPNVLDLIFQNKTFHFRILLEME